MCSVVCDSQAAVYRQAADSFWPSDSQASTSGDQWSGAPGYLSYKSYGRNPEATVGQGKA